MRKPLSTGSGGLPIDVDCARLLAKRLHDGQFDAGGAPLIEHVRRVAAAAVSRGARVVAWLHEAFEHSAISAESLLAEGVSTDDLRALKLLTRATAWSPGDTSAAHTSVLNCPLP